MRKTIGTLLLSLGLLAAAASAGCGSSARPASGTVARSDRPAATRPTNPAREVTSGVGAGLSNLWDTISQQIDNLTGNTPSKYARLTLSESADERRMGIDGLVEKPFGRGEPYTDRYTDMARGDADPLVRAVALRALNRSRDKRAVNLFTQSLQDPNVQIRLEACKGLLRNRDPDAAPALLAVLNNPNEDKDVRIAAADALRRYKTLEVARALVSNLSNRDFGIAWQSRRSLTFLTGRDLRYDEAAWLAYLTGPEKPFG